MIGMVLWCDPVSRKAVIWCEDQGDLAFFDETAGDGAPFFDAGDMVRMEITVEGSFRRATSARLVLEGACTALPQRLRNCAAPAQDCAQVVEFPEGGVLKKVASGR